MLKEKEKRISDRESLGWVKGNVRREVDSPRSRADKSSRVVEEGEGSISTSKLE